jgi:ABC-type transport system substrate-binding protein
VRDRKRSGRARVAAAAVIAAMSALLLLAAPAFAASSAQQGYSTPGEKVQTTFDPHHTTLPFTGLDVFAIVAVGGVLLVVGLGVRRISRNAAAH